MSCLSAGISMMMLALTATGALLFPVSAQAEFYVEGLATAFAANAVPDRLEQRVLRTEALTLERTLRNVGPVGNFSEARVSAELRTVTLGVSLYAENAFNAGSEVYNGAGGQAWAGLGDRLYFTVPAGFYAADQIVTLTGMVEGFISTLGDSFSHATARWDYHLYDLSFATTDRFVGTTGVVNRGDSVNVLERFTLRHPIVSAGTTVPEETIVPLGFDASLVVTNVSAGSPFVPNVTSADFATSGRILSIALPEGVTFTSASGAFLVPLPPAFALFVSALLGLMLFRFRGDSIAASRAHLP